MNQQRKNKRATLSVSVDTKLMLDSIRRTGQSYNGLIRELVEFWKKEKEPKSKVSNK